MSAYIIYFILILLPLSILFVVIVLLWELFTRRTKKRHGFHPDKHHPLTLARSDKNPILMPGGQDWEREAVMNPAAVKDEDGTVHLFYRAIGSDGVSRIGYARSKDGVQFEERLAYPVFALPREASSMDWRRRLHMHPGLLASGGTWSGTEDPRAVIMDNRMYLSFSAFEGWDSVRIGVTSISLDDLRAQKWHWTPPTFLSPPHQVHKNWVLFPEKIMGKFAILHSISPKVEIAYRDSLDAIGKTAPHIEVTQGPRVSGRQGHWDNRVRGAGPPPLKTPRGWLLFYHANDGDRFAHQYRLGAMLLDLVNPERVIARSSMPVLTPEAHYENNGAKPGIVYACGAVIRGTDLHVYYGAADTVIGTAVTKLSDFLDRMVTPSVLQPAPVLFS